ncbi:uncharacterized protein LOC111241662 isoform X2 [Vigna radiata var. radiata]|uniref:Uncharacterized protein LOC111241662 isoform X2 n=1 Tax=Vigna radiata var. radiata TaxID=3916 RepID=A0A3Q0EXB1_VIGRR|nr:uncharacterized protein LOC111241662 isoform X2 [Vigna radiata var. radiata]
MINIIYFISLFEFIIKKIFEIHLFRYGDELLLSYTISSRDLPILAPLGLRNWSIVRYRPIRVFFFPQVIMSSASMYSSEESAGQGGVVRAGGAEGGTSTGPGISGARASGMVVRSPDEVLSSFLEGSDDSGPSSPVYGGERIVNGIGLFLLRGGIRVDSEMPEPAGGWPRIQGYRWASPDVDLYTSDFGTRAELLWWSKRSQVARDVEDARFFRLGVSHPNERVFHGKGNCSEDFFFVYTYMFDQLYVRISFTSFQASVLQELNIAPSQFHPNGWAAIQAFTSLCAAVGVPPMVKVFLHYFNVRPLPRRGWVSLSSVSDWTLFKFFSESFKNFKTRYFKVIIKGSGRSEFFDDGAPMFPFYWTQDLRRMNAFAIGRMNPEERDVVRVINDLSRRLKARGFVDSLKYEDFDQIAFGYMSLPAPRKTS